MHHPRTIHRLNFEAERQKAAANKAGQVWEQGSYQVAKAVLAVADEFFDQTAEAPADAAVPQADGDQTE